MSEATLVCYVVRQATKDFWKYEVNREKKLKRRRVLEARLKNRLLNKKKRIRLTRDLRNIREWQKIGRDAKTYLFSKNGFEGSYFYACLKSIVDIDGARRHAIQGLTDKSIRDRYNHLEERA